MSVASLQRRFVTPLVKKLNQDVRKKVERQRGQLLILDDLSGFEKVLKASGFNPTSTQLKKALKAGQAQALKLQNNFISRDLGSRRFKTLEQKFPTIDFKRNGLTLGKNAFLVSNFRSSLNSVKKAIFDVLQEDLGFTDSQRKGFSAQVQKGHGEEGLAVSQVKAAQTFARAAELEGGAEVLLKNLDHAINQADIDEGYKQEHRKVLNELSLTYENVVTKKGDLRADYFSIITYQSSGDNAEDKLIEEQFIKLVREYVNKDFAKDIITIPGSSSILDKVEGAIVENFKSGPNVKVTTSGKPKSGTVSKGTVTKSNNKSKPRGKIKRHAKSPLTRVNARKTSQGEASPIALMALINAKLGATVAQNMGPPALTNRTGRFAESVRVMEITKTPQGFPSIGYTYLKEPYQVFEPGAGKAPWANPNRDPRTLIDRSIREIAKELLIGRFYTRRI